MDVRLTRAGKELVFRYRGLEPRHNTISISAFVPRQHTGYEQVGWITIRKGDVVGGRGRPFEPRTACYQVSGIEVYPAWRRTGVGTALYEEAARLSAESGVALCSDTVLSDEAAEFWHKQVRKGRAFWEVPGPPELEDRNFDYGRYVLSFPPPASLEGPPETIVYFASHKPLDRLDPRPIRNYNSMGTWFTSSPIHARTFYGPIVYAFELPAGRYLEAHTDDFDAFFLNWPRAREHLAPDDFEHLEVHPPGTARFDHRASRIMQALLLDADYIRDFRENIERANYDGIVWFDSRIDTRPGEPTHDVYMLFQREPLYPVEEVFAEPLPPWRPPPGWKRATRSAFPPG